MSAILLVDDEAQFLLSASFALNTEGLNDILTLQDSREVLELLRSRPVSVIALDMMMPFLTGEELLPRIHSEFPEIPVIIITAINDVDTAVQCMKTGAFDYIVKPVDDARLITSIRRALKFRAVEAENRALREYLLSDKLEHPEHFSGIVTRSPAMRSVFQYIEAVAPTPLPMLITGETGTGKELIAQSIHAASDRKGRFVALNVAGVDDQLFSDTLFGHVRGAFTGADKTRNGLIEQAADGTLFLDEIGDLSPESQVKLLRLLQEGSYYPLGSDVLMHSNARIVLATHRDIDAMQRADRFRKDLYYRLKAHQVHLPPLRERGEDIPLLLDHFLSRAAEKLGKNRPAVPPELHVYLKNYAFPGNIRELEGMVTDAVTRHRRGVLSTASFRDAVGLPEEAGPNGDGREATLHHDPLPEIHFENRLPNIKEMEWMLIEEAMKRSDGNQTLAARMLGLSRRALNNRIQRRRKHA